jgi:hypothetical protein
MVASMTEMFDRVAATAVLAVMLAGIPLGGVMFVVQSLAV